jgi:hypothetical protein
MSAEERSDESNTNRKRAGMSPILSSHPKKLDARASLLNGSDMPEAFFKQPPGISPLDEWFLL